MEKLERVITALELCTDVSQDDCMMLCPYKDEQDETYGLCEHIMKQDALALLKEYKEHEELLTKVGYYWMRSGETLALCKKSKNGHGMKG